MARAPLCRIFHLTAHFNRGEKVQITAGASPWGIGGWLAIDGLIIFYFFEAITEQDALSLKTARFASDGQQV